MPVNNAAGAQVRIVGRIHGQQTINVLNFATEQVVNDDATGVALLKQLANAVRQCVEDTLIPAVTQDWTFLICDARKIHPTLGDSVESDAPTEVVGNLSPSSTGFIASLAKISTGGGGRSGRGRIFLPPAGEANTLNGEIDGPTMLLLAEFLACIAAKFIGAGPPGGWNLGVLSRKKVNNVLPPFNNRWRDAIGLNMAKEAAVLSSRKIGNGR